MKENDIKRIIRLLAHANEFEVRATRIFCEKIMNLEDDADADAEPPDNGDNHA